MDDINLQLFAKFYEIVVLKRGILKDFHIGLQIMDLKLPLYVYYILCVFCIYNSIYCFSDTCYIVNDISIIFWILCSV